MKYMDAPLREQYQEHHYADVTLKQNVVAALTQYRVIGGNLKRLIKNGTFYTCRLFAKLNFSMY